MAPSTDSSSVDHVLVFSRAISIMLGTSKRRLKLGFNNFVIFLCSVSSTNYVGIFTFLARLCLLWIKINLRFLKLIKNYN